MAVQDLQTKNGKAGRWTKSGEVLEVLPYNSYLIKIHGSRAVTKRNRRFLRKITPFSPIIPVKAHEHCNSPNSNRASYKTVLPADTSDQLMISQPLASKPAPEVPLELQASLQPQTAPAPDLQGSVGTEPDRPRGAAATAHRLQPAASPGQDLIGIMKQREAQGLHLALEQQGKKLPSLDY